MKYLKYSDVALVPRYSTTISRSIIDTSTNIGRYRYKLPIIPANMKCVIDKQLAHWMAYNQYFYIMHRFGINNLQFVIDANQTSLPQISISIGVKP